MFGMAELVTVYVIKNGLENLAANPDQCRFILGGFSEQPLRSLVSMDHINQAVEFVTKNRIQVAPYYEMDIKQRPSVAIVSSGAETQQYLGDYGRTEISSSQAVMTPVVYAEFDAKLLDGDTLIVSPELKIEKKIWPGVIVANGKFTARVQGILVRDGDDTRLQLDTAIPAGTQYKGWKAQSLPREKGVEILSSMDKVTLQANLMTTGSASVHRLLALVIRYCLKRGRQLFEIYGLQVPTVSYSPLMLTDDGELEYQSVFTIETMVSDSWIHREFDLNDNTKNIVVHPFIAEPVNKEENDDVTLG
jgi:hypothetical protein